MASKPLTRPVRTEQDRQALLRLLEARPLPFTCNVLKGAPRSLDQNRLQRLWLKEAEEQGDDSAEGYRRYCKLHFGVPILRAENEAFREQYDRIIKPLTYEQKLELMGEPIDFPVTRLMTTRQNWEYLNQVEVFFRGLGFELTDPEAIGLNVSKTKPKG